MDFFIIGLNHKTAPVGVRERLFVDPDKLREILRECGDDGRLGEVMILSTCNRVEVYSTAESAEEARLNGLGALSSQRGVELSSLEPFLYTKVGAEAIRHAFRVASSLDSMILGEPQILGQVKDAFQVAQDCQTTGPILHAVMTQAFSVAKKVRTETGVARHAVSVSVAAVELARKIFGGLRGKAVLLGHNTGQNTQINNRHEKASRGDFIRECHEYQATRRKSSARAFPLSTAYSLRPLSNRRPDHILAVR
jgi:glutamyl-tRNA reductase